MESRATGDDHGIAFCPIDVPAVRSRRVLALDACVGLSAITHP